MTRTRRIAHLRSLRRRARRTDPAALARHLVEDGDPLGLAPLAHAAWAEEALLVLPAELHARACQNVARDLYGAAPATLWAAWLAAHVAGAAASFLAEDPRARRPRPTEPSAFEQAVAACFGVADERAAALIVAFHGLTREDRAAVHALLPRSLFGLAEPAPGRTHPRPAGRHRAARALALMRQIVAATLAGPG